MRLNAAAPKIATDIMSITNPHFNNQGPLLATTGDPCTQHADPCTQHAEPCTQHADPCRPVLNILSKELRWYVWGNSLIFL